MAGARFQALCPHQQAQNTALAPTPRARTATLLIATHMHPFWRDTLRHGLQVLAFCCVIAVFTTMMWPGSGYARQLVHSISIGMITWAVIEFGRLLVPAQHCHRNPDTGGHGWPRGWRGGSRRRSR